MQEELELFNCDKPRGQQYDRYRAHPEWNRIYSLLADGYWHCTSRNGWEAIQESQAIKPNIGGRYPSRFSKSESSFAFQNECIALFDFVDPSEEQVIENWRFVWEFIIQTPEAVLIRLDRNQLAEKIIPNSHAFDKKGHRPTLGCIPFCEVWYPEDISTRVIISVFTVCGGPAHGLLELSLLSDI